MKRTFLLFLLSLPVVFCKDISAQGFLKKVAKSIESASKEVDKALKLEKTSETKPATEAAAAVQGTAASLLFSSPYVNNLKPITPYFTENTKVFYVESDKDFGNNNVAYFDFTNFNEGGIAFIKDPKTGKWGAIDTLGNQIIKYKFDWDPYMGNSKPAPNITDGVFVTWGNNFKLNGTVLVDVKGNVVKNLPDIYDFSNFTGGVASAKMNVVDKKKSSSYRTVTYPRIVYFNTKGELIYPEISFDCPGEMYLDLIAPASFANGRAYYRDYHKKRWGYIDRAGKIIIPAIYKNVSGFREGMAVVQNENDYWGYIDTEGKTVIDFRFSTMPGSFSNGIAIVRKRGDDNASYCFMDKTGKIIKENMYYVYRLPEGLYYVMHLSKQLGTGLEMEILQYNSETSAFKTIYSRKDDATIEEKMKNEGHFTEKWSYSDGIASVDGGVISKYGQYLLEADRYGGPFSYGLAKCYVNKKGKYRPAYINKKGEIVIIFEEPEF
ncbi:MAG: WG repeat-containing protein [Prevotella sp.]|jgi:hypothetical protein|nr:WG repeat-containing protein [Prevotella sp.]